MIQNKIVYELKCKYNYKKYKQNIQKNKILNLCYKNYVNFINIMKRGNKKKDAFDKLK